MAKSGGDMLVAKYDFYATESSELTITEGETLILIDASFQWWKVKNAAGQIGYVPSNYVKPAKNNIFASLRNTFKKHKNNIYSTLSKRSSSAPSEQRKTEVARGLDLTRGAQGTSKATDSTLRLQKGISLLDTNGLNAYSIDGLNSVAPLPRNIPCRVYTPVDDSVYGRNSDASIAVTSGTNQNIRPDGFPEFPSRNSPTHQSDRVYAPPVGLIPDSLARAQTPDPSRVAEVCLVVLPYTAKLSDELNLEPGQRIRVIKRSEDGWWYGNLMNANGTVACGWFPSNLVVMASPRTLYRNPNRTAITRPCNPESDLVFNSRNRMLSSLTPQPCTTTDMNYLRRPLPEISEHPTSLPLGMWAKVMYPYIRNEPNQLSVNMNEVIEVIGKPSPNWWQCRNHNGEVGLVPRNYLMPISGNYAIPVRREEHTPLLRSLPHNTNDLFIDGESIRLFYAKRSVLAVSMAPQPWFWGTVTRAQSENMLGLFAYPGEFLVRESESRPRDLTISIRTMNKVRNFQIHLDGGQFQIGRKIFPSMPLLIMYYHTHLIFNSGHEQISLSRPFTHPGLSNFSGTSVGPATPSVPSPLLGPVTDETSSTVARNDSLLYAAAFQNYDNSFDPPAWPSISRGPYR
ncbi:unnamed protein product [Calicophoron daubneyi]|uniref:SH3 domain-containing protein n=1 Tax=Calicophoron daubneyi TaxID=300641 RepID=A0AAV2TPS0_CALDB